jgi:hypothetical protein
MLRFLQTVRDFFGVLMQLGGSPFDCSDWDRLTGIAWHARGQGFESP